MDRLDNSTGERSTTAELRDWVQERLHLDPESAAELLHRVEEVVEGFLRPQDSNRPDNEVAGRQPEDPSTDFSVVTQERTA